MNVTNRQLRAFVAVAETGSFTRAADRLCVTQSALSVMIRELETEVGIRLLDRTTRVVVLTAAGREFLKSAVRVLGDLECAIRDAREVVARQQGQVIVGVPPLAGATFMPPMISRLKAVCPDVCVVLRDMRPDDIASGVTTGSIDFGLGEFDEAVEPIRRVVLLREPLMLVCATDHRLAGVDVVRWSDLPGLPLITIAHDHTVRSMLDHTFGQLGFSVLPSFEVYHVLTAIAMVVAGLGVAVFPSWVGAASQLYKISVRQIEEPTMISELAMISHSDREMTKAMERFEQYFTDQLASMHWGDSHAFGQ